MIGLIPESSCQIVKAVKDPSFSVRHSEVPSVDVVVSHSGVHPPQNGGNYEKLLCKVRVEKLEVLGPGEDIGNIKRSKKPTYMYLKHCLSCILLHSGAHSPFSVSIIA